MDPMADPAQNQPPASTPGTLRRKLGRGLGSLISAPVRVEIPLSSNPVASVAATPGADITGSVGERLATFASLPTTASGQSLPNAAQTESADLNRVHSIPLTQIRADPKQPRQSFDPAALETLVASIRASGLMQPILVRPISDGGLSGTGAAGGAEGVGGAGGVGGVGGVRGATYQIVAGERRWRAAHLAGLATIPALVRELDDRTAAEFSLVENLQREDLNPIERAEAFIRLIHEFKFTHLEIADRIGIDRTNVTNHIRLNELDAPTKTAMRQGAVSMGQAKALLSITNLEIRGRIAGSMLRHGWSVRETEKQARLALEAEHAAGGPTGAAGAALPGASGGGGGAMDANAAGSRGLAPHMADLQRRLGEHLGTRVRIQPGRNKGSGKLTIDFFSLDQFEGLLHRLDFAGDE